MVYFTNGRNHVVSLNHTSMMYFLRWKSYRQCFLWCNPLMLMSLIGHVIRMSCVWYFYWMSATSGWIPGVLSFYWIGFVYSCWAMHPAHYLSVDVLMNVNVLCTATWDLVQYKDHLCVSYGNSYTDKTTSLYWNGPYSPPVREAAFEFESPWRWLLLLPSGGGEAKLEPEEVSQKCYRPSTKCSQRFQTCHHVPLYPLVTQ